MTESHTHRILIAEDDADLARMLKMLLKSMGDVRTAEDGMDAYGQMRGGFLPDLLITDVMMPRMDGISLVRRMKQDKDLARIPVLILTAKHQPRDVIAGINAGAKHYLTKPFKQHELLEKVRHALGIC
ncbi:MAG: response regulator [Deltaproteobacteria bacterium]|nr:response regulator [Deltaproteobacteria bacterium]